MSSAHVCTLFICLIGTLHTYEPYCKRLTTPIASLAHLQDDTDWISIGSNDIYFPLGSLLIFENAIETVWKIVRDPQYAIHRQGYEGKLLKLLLRLVLKYDTLPSSLVLKGVQCTDGESCGSGGFADVYYGEFDSEPVALKRLRVYASAPDSKKHELKQAFLREAILWMNLSHDNVLRFIGVAEDVFRNPSVCMIIPWMHNGNIRQYRDKLQTDGKLAGPAFEEHVNEWLYGIAKGMAYLHREGIVHGDLHGGNVLVDATGDVKLTDFGMALIADATSYKYASVHGGGALRWAAPELHAPEKFGLTSHRPTNACDVYSFAYVCIELWTGERPFEGLSEYQVISRVVAGERPPRPDKPKEITLPDNLWSVVTLCWRGDPAERPLSEMVVQYIETARAELALRSIESETLQTSSSLSVFGHDDAYPPDSAGMPDDISTRAVYDSQVQSPKASSTLDSFDRPPADRVAEPRDHNAHNKRNAVFFDGTLVARGPIGSDMKLVPTFQEHQPWDFGQFPGKTGLEDILKRSAALDEKLSSVAPKYYTNIHLRGLKPKLPPKTPYATARYNRGSSTGWQSPSIVSTIKEDVFARLVRRESSTSEYIEIPPAPVLAASQNPENHEELDNSMRSRLKHALSPPGWGLIRRSSQSPSRFAAK
ncbi:hypothetical protein EIP91_011636 [Steccherinum ochraceum]|uniref:Protein kinase domain-containing protein n=1 Tax=Steccherinum ochraceum TaxID=92696 RepID=A0A4R0RPG5_9APHY|nr:hypothetical protein EIP91_011636 [Steccherinum ochraceum]